jgi:hypothetical protein
MFRLIRRSRDFGAQGRARKMWRMSILQRLAREALLVERLWSFLRPEKQDARVSGPLISAEHRHLPVTSLNQSI